MVLTESDGQTIREIFPNPEIIMSFFTQSEIDTNQAVTLSTMDNIKFAVTLRNNAGTLAYLAHTIEVSGEKQKIKLTDGGETDVAITGFALGFRDSAVAAANTGATLTEATGTKVERKLAPGPAEGILVFGDCNMTTNEAVPITPLKNGIVEGAYILKSAVGILTQESAVIDDSNELHKIKNATSNASNVDCRFMAWGFANSSSDNSGSDLTSADNINLYKVAPGPSEYKAYYFEATMSTDESVTFSGLDVIDGAIAYKYASGATTEQTLTIEIAAELNKIKNTTTNSDVTVRGIVWGRKNSAGTLLA